MKIVIDNGDSYGMNLYLRFCVIQALSSTTVSKSMAGFWELS